jgi:TonB family protein
MNTDHSAREYHPTIIESRLLIRRLAIQIDFLKDELRRNWIDFKSNPVVFARRSARDAFRDLNKLLSTPNAAPACLTAVAAIAALVLLALLIERTGPFRERPLESSGPAVELVLLNVSKPPDSPNKPSIGKDGPGRVGFQNSKGEGSGHVRRDSGGGGGGGNRDPKPPQAGKLPPPSTIVAAIPIAPPVHPPALPVAGIDIDPALWKDLKAPVYGDPRSKSEIPSKGPGDGEGIGTNRGTGIGEGIGPGVGPGRDGNMGDGSRQTGCCGPGGGSDRTDGTFRGAEVEQRARLLYKPEPQYTEEARRNQITGTVMLRVVFSSAGEVVQIRAVRTLPFGLTERAIAAARQIKFVPAMKGGRAVSVFMQLEYNFNLY